MLFGVTDAPYIRVYGTSSEALEELFLKLMDLGIYALEIGYFNQYEGLDWLSYLKNLRELTRDLPVEVSMHAPGGDISSTNKEIRVKSVEKIGKAIDDFGEAIGGGKVVVHPEDTTPVKPFKVRERRENCVKSLEFFSEVAREYGVKVALENMRWRRDKPRRTGMYLWEVANIIRCLNKEVVGICFDVGHANISEGEGLYRAFEANVGRVVHIHLNDNHGYHSEDEHFEPGEGTVDLKRFCRILKKVKYEGAVILEVSKMNSGDDFIRFYERNAKRFQSALS